MPPEPARVILADGDVPGLLALRAALDAGCSTVLLWPAAAPEPEIGARLAAVRQQAELLGARLFGPSEAALCERSAGVSAELLTVALAGAEAGCSGLVWPVAAGATNRGADAVGRIGAAVERAARVMSLVELDYPGFEVSAPYADLSDRQLADLILDLDLPIWTCWWYATREGSDPVGAAAAARREHWGAMLNAAGWRGPLPGPGARVAARTA